jgi:phytoene dehydrogenase-like protein
MPRRLDAIIIGSGIGGAGIGALLAHAGWGVLILEKNALLGGRCITYERAGCVMDLGWHFYCLGEKGPLQEIATRVGAPAIPWNNVGSRSFLQIGDVVKKYSKAAMFEAVHPAERAGFERLFRYVFETPDAELERLWYVPVWEWVDRFTKDRMAHTIIESFVSQYFCVPSIVASTAEFIRAFRDVMSKRATAYPTGGNESVPGAYLAAVEEHGGKVITRAEVSRILVEDGAAVGVVLADGTEFRAPVIVSNADLRATVLKLAGKEHFPADYVKKVQGLTYSVPGVMLRVLVSEKVTDKQVVIYIPDERSAPLDVTPEMQRGEIPELVAGCFGSPTNFDPSMAPDGKQLLTSLHGCPPDMVGRADEWCEALLRSCYRVFPEARGKVEKVWLDTPALVNGFAGEDGAIIGVGQTVDQVHERRPSVVSPLKGLYFASGEAGGHGIGTELAASSALELFGVLSGLRPGVVSARA